MAIDPIVAAKERDRERRDAEEKLKAWRAAWPIVLIPTAADIALGYHWISADDSQIYDEPRKVTPRKALDAARGNGWWCAASQTLSLDVKRGDDRPHRREQIGVHAFWPSRQARPGTIGIVAWWCNREFEWAARADYFEHQGRVAYRRVTVGARELVKMLKRA